jgi:hypothetical protein
MNSNLKNTLKQTDIVCSRGCKRKPQFFPTMVNLGFIINLS